MDNSRHVVKPSLNLAQILLNPILDILLLSVVFFWSGEYVLTVLIIEVLILELLLTCFNFFLSFFVLILF